jgi:uncharacterized protein
MSLVRCPICGNQIESEQSQTMPFCSERCRTIDLGRWLDERHGLPYENERKSENQETE